jgi:glycine/D-amino acid oxidase-like deaminating enzyme
MDSPRKVVIGQSYAVPCIKMEDEWFGVLGPLHEDVDILGPQATAHYHYDPRFLSDEELVRFTGAPPENDMAAPFILAHLLKEFTDGPELREKECFRQMPNFIRAPRGYIPALEERYKDACIDPENPICPHRKFPLVGNPSEDGIVICSGHGLQWSLITGKLVPEQLKEDGTRQTGEEWLRMMEEEARPSN